MTTTPSYRLHIDFLELVFSTSNKLIDFLEDRLTAPFLKEQNYKNGLIERYTYLIDKKIKIHTYYNKHQEKLVLFIKILNPNFYDPKEPFNPTPDTLIEALNLIKIFVRHFNLEPIYLKKLDISFDFNYNLIRTRTAEDYIPLNKKVLTKDTAEATDTGQIRSIYFNTSTNQNKQPLSLILYQKGQLLNTKEKDKKVYQNPDEYTDTRLEIRLQYIEKKSISYTILDNFFYFLIEKPSYILQNLHLISLYIMDYYKDYWTTDTTTKTAVLNIDTLFNYTRYLNDDGVFIEPYSSKIEPFLSRQKKLIQDRTKINKDNYNKRVLHRGSILKRKNYKELLTDLFNLYSNKFNYTFDPIYFLELYKDKILNILTDKNISYQDIEQLTPRGTLINGTDIKAEAHRYILNLIYTNIVQPDIQDLFLMDLEDPPF